MDGIGRENQKKDTIRICGGSRVLSKTISDGIMKVNLRRGTTVYKLGLKRFHNGLIILQ